MTKVKKDIIEFELNPRQEKQAKLFKDAYGKIILWKNKNKVRLLNPDEITVFNYK